MEEPQRARPHTVTTTASSFAENFSTTSSSFAYDREFLRTVPGLLIVAEIVSAWREGAGRRRRRRTRACAPGLRASSDPLTGFQGTLVAQPRLLPQVQNSDHLSQRGPVALGSVG